MVMPAENAEFGAVERPWWDIASDIVDPLGSKSLADGELWTPYPKQQIAEELSGQVDELLFGGAAGPGKTEWGIRHVVRQMEMFPGNRGGIFRRVFPSLQRTIIPRMRVLLYGKAKYNQNTHEFTFPNGSVIECSSLQHSATVLEHQGVEYGVIFFEEITEFLRSQWEYMIGRLRAPVAGVHPHAIATTNPGGTGHRWVKRRWVKPKPEDLEPNSIRPGPMEKWVPRSTAENPEPLMRAYVPATHKDNPALLKKDPGYLNRLRSITDRGLRLAMEKGDWDAIDAVVGALWKQAELDEGRISPAYFTRKVKTLRRVVAVDPSDGDDEGDIDDPRRALGDGYGVAVCSRGLDGHGYVERSYEWFASVREMARATINVYNETGADAIVVERNHGGKWMVEVFKSVDPFCNVETVWASDGKRTRAKPVSNLFEKNLDNPRVPYRCHMVGEHEELEEELTTHNFDSGMASPNRLDAMVWGLTKLVTGDRLAYAESGVRDRRAEGRR